jgi:hypothetical protein
MNSNLQSAVKDSENVQIMTKIIIERKCFRDNILLLAKCTRVDRHQLLSIGIECPHLNALITRAGCDASCAPAVVSAARLSISPPRPILTEWMASKRPFNMHGQSEMLKGLIESHLGWTMLQEDKISQCIAVA